MGTAVNDGLEIVAVKVATLQAPLPVPVVFGNWVMRHREFAICGVVADDGTVGVSFCYTRDGPIQALVERLIAPRYVGGDPSDPAALFDAAAWSNNAVLASGVGHRAVSLVDVATWDLAAKLRRETIEQMLGGTPGRNWRRRSSAIRRRWIRRSCASRCGPDRRGLAPLQAAGRADAGGDARAACNGARVRRRAVARPRHELDLQGGTTRSTTSARSSRSGSAGSRTSCRPATRTGHRNRAPRGRRADRDGRRAGRRVPPGGAAAGRRRRRRAGGRQRRTAASPACGGSLGELGDRRFTTHMFPHVHSRALQRARLRGKSRSSGASSATASTRSATRSRARSSSTG